MEDVLKSKLDAAFNKKNEASKDEKKEEVVSTDTSTTKEISKETQNTETKPFFERVKKHNINVANDDEVEQLILNTQKQISEYTAKEGEYKKQIDEYNKYKELYEEGIDPLQFFSDANAYKREQLKKELPTIPIDLAEKIVLGNTGEMSAQELISVDYRLKYPTLTDNEISALIEQKYGLEDDRTEAQKAMMKVDSIEANKVIDGLKSKVKEPQKIDIKAIQESRQKEYQEHQTKLTTDWTREFNLNGFTKFDVVDRVDGKDVVIYSQEVEEDFRKEAAAELIKILVKDNIEITPDTIRMANEEAVDLYRRKHFLKIVKNATQNAVDEALKEERKKENGFGNVNRQDGKTITGNTLTKADRDRMIHGI